jgi:hypothetical protein
MKHWIVSAMIAMATAASFILESSFPTTAKDFKLDELGNVYLIYDNHLERCTPSGQVQFRSSELNFGTIEYLDVTNALKPFIYYKDQNKVVVLDNTLSEQGQFVDLFDLGYGQIEWVAGSRGDAYWLWDVSNSELLRTDQSFRKTNASGNVSILTRKDIYPRQLLEKGNTVYVVDEKHGILLFDIYGTYRTLLPIHPEGDIQVIDDRLVYRKDGVLHVVEKDLLSEENIPLPMQTDGPFNYFKGKLYLLQQNRLSIYNR